MLDTKQHKSCTFEIVLCTRKPDKKINVLGDTMYLPGDPSGSKYFCTDDAGKLADFFERNVGKKKRKKNVAKANEGKEKLDEKNVGRTVVKDNVD